MARQLTTDHCPEATAPTVASLQRDDSRVRQTDAHSGWLVVSLLAIAICITSCTGSTATPWEQELLVLRTRVTQLENRIDALQTQAQATPAADMSPTTTQPQIDELAEAAELGFRCEQDLPDAKAGPCRGPTLVEYWGTRGIRALAPVNWRDSLSDAMGSGSSAEWWNPDDPEERIHVSTGVSKGMWYEIDGVESSIDPKLMISDSADIYPQSRTVFVYVDSEDGIAILGVWRVTQSYDGDDCCYYHAQIRLRYDNGLNAHFWNMFLDHQLQVVAGTDFAVEFQYHELGYRFRSGGNNGNKILFTRNCWECEEGIFVMNADGTGVGQLTNNPSQILQPSFSTGDYDPVWSPDGNKIAFERVSDSCCWSAIFVMNADGTGIEQLTDNDSYESMPVWSPDGTKIAFEKYQDGDHAIFVVNADGTGIQQLIATDTIVIEPPAWSPDGTKIAFTSDRDGRWDIFVVNADGTGIEQLTDNDSYDSDAVWSPDGTKIAFNRGWGIFVMNADGTGIEQLTDPRRPKSHDWDSDPVWSPDGTKIAFEGLRGSTVATWGPYGDTQIFVMNADGTGVKQLTDNEHSSDDPVWSPDGTKIAFNGRPDGRSEIFVMNADGSNVTALGPGSLSSWGG